MALPSQFFDPFFGVPALLGVSASSLLSSEPGKLLSAELYGLQASVKHNAILIEQDNAVETKQDNAVETEQDNAVEAEQDNAVETEQDNGVQIDQDNGLKVLVPKITNTLSIRGQGTISVRTTASNLLQFCVLPDPDGSRALYLDIGANEIFLYSEGLEGRVDIPFEHLQPLDASTISQGVQTIYWLSIDANNGILRYGKHFTNKTMTLIESRLKTPDPKTEVLARNNSEQYSWLESLKTIKVSQDRSTELLSAIIHPLPVVIDLPPFVVSEDKLTLQDIATGTFTAPANLPKACQVLYGNVAGQQILLDDDDFPNFSDAIQRSCITPGLWAYEKLKSKNGEFSKDDKGTYLRITLGYNVGDSPGIPYVLEIWPAGHYSPIHDHGNSCAVIKVLHGEINCTWYNSLTDPKGTLLIGEGRLRKGQITWIGPKNYQIHKLHNKSKAVCCTIQCYRYADEDNVHYDGFDWKNEQGRVEKFVPNSDMSFTDFRAIMKQEWDASDPPE